MASCRQKKNSCEWRSAAALEQIDRKKCLKQDPAQDSIYARLRQFSLSFNPFRKEKGIPVLEPDFECLYFYPGDIRWSGDIKDGKFTPPDHPYLKWKTVRWRADTLLADYNLFVKNPEKDRWGTTLEIQYYKDTLQQQGYLFRYIYQQDSKSPEIDFSRAQVDSVLKEWGIPSR